MALAKGLLQFETPATIKELGLGGRQMEGHFKFQQPSAVAKLSLLKCRS
jgi:hypothetical protein